MYILDFWCWYWNNKHDIYNSKNKTFWVDISDENINYCKNKYPYQTFIKTVWDEKLPFKNEYFDKIQSLDVLEHVDDLDHNLNEISRVSKKGSIFIVEVPYRKSENYLLNINKDYWKQVHHVRMFKNNEMEKILKNYWFKLIKKNKIKFFDNIVLAYLLKNWKIINQKWEFNIKAPKILAYISYTMNYEAATYSKKAKIFILPFYYLFSPFRYFMDNIFPKSIYYEFVKL